MLDHARMFAPAIDPFDVIARLTALMDCIGLHHRMGMGWGTLRLPSRILVSADDGPLSVLERAPLPSDPSAEARAADRVAVWRLLGDAAAIVRANTTPAWLADALQIGIENARSGTTVSRMRNRMLQNLTRLLRRARMRLGRQIDNAGTTDIRLDLWSTSGDENRADVRQFLGAVLKQSSGSGGRGRLGKLVEQRALVKRWLERLDALRDGQATAARPTTSIVEFTLDVVQPVVADVTLLTAPTRPHGVEQTGRDSETGGVSPERRRRLISRSENLAQRARPVSPWTPTPGIGAPSAARMSAGGA